MPSLLNLGFNKLKLNFIYKKGTNILTSKNLFMFIGSLVGIRVISAVFGLISMSVAYNYLGSENYLEYSLVVALSGVFSVAIFTPFSKFTLLSNPLENIEGAVLGVAIYLLIFSMASTFFLEERWTYAIFFATSQGLKEYFVEKFRVTHEYKSVFASYLVDSVITCVLFIAIGLLGTSYEVFVICSAVSSFLIILLLAFRAKLLAPVFMPKLIFCRYWQALNVSVFMLVSGFSISSLLYRCRDFLVFSFGSEIGGHLNYVLDMIQRPIALVSSSIITSLVPLRNVTLKLHANRLSGLLLLAICASLLLVAGLLPYIGNVFWGDGIFSAPAYAYVWIVGLVFMNRMKSTMVEVPLNKIGSGRALLLTAAPILLLLLAFRTFYNNNIALIVVPVTFLISSCLGVLQWQKYANRAEATVIIIYLYVLISINFLVAMAGLNAAILIVLNGVALIFTMRKLYSMLLKGSVA